MNWNFIIDVFGFPLGCAIGGTIGVLLATWVKRAAANDIQTLVQDVYELEKSAELETDEQRITRLAEDALTKFVNLMGEYLQPKAIVYYNITDNSVINEVLTERAKQISKGYDAGHDDGHYIHDLVSLAACILRPDTIHYPFDVGQGSNRPAKWMSMNDRDRCLRAAAVCVATVERIDRERNVT